jgi:hypothetical protein
LLKEATGWKLLGLAASNIQWHCGHSNLILSFVTKNILSYLSNQWLLNLIRSLILSKKRRIAEEINQQQEVISRETSPELLNNRI